RAMEVLDDPTRAFASSAFVRLELLPKARYYGRTDEVDFYEAFFAAVSDWAEPLDQLIRDALAEASQTGLAAMDALHVAAAAPAGEELERQLALFRDACALARDLAPAAPPPLASPIGSSAQEWEEALPLVLERVGLFGETAGREGCRFALEPHVHGLLDRPER